MNPLDFNKKLQKARTLINQGDHTQGLSLYAGLVQRYPQSGLRGEYARAAIATGDYDLAERIWEKIRTREPNTAELLCQLAWEYQSIHLHPKARALFSEAASIEPRNLDAQVKLAWLLARTTGAGEARTVVNNCLNIDPCNEEARWLSAHLDRRDNKLADAERQLRELLASGPKSPQVNYSCHSELAQILDRTERFDEAMAMLDEGKKITRQNGNAGGEQKAFLEWYEATLRKTQSLPKNTLAAWSKAFPANARTVARPLAFLTGCARSGTTLLERILDAHPAVAACDEPLAFQTILPSVDFTAPSIPAQRLNWLRERYLKNLAKASGPVGADKLFLDKNPSRTIWLPAFLRAFPELRVLIALRDPRDVMISLYFQDQGNTNPLTFEQLARHYAHVMDVWLAVREWEGLVCMETRYEDVVADLEKEGGRVTKFLGLEWHENQARFHESNREKPVMSTNYKDVTRPVYSKSVGRWRAYEKQLAPILPALEPYCKKFGYA